AHPSIFMILRVRALDGAAESGLLHLRGVHVNALPAHRDDTLVAKGWPKRVLKVRPSGCFQSPILSHALSSQLSNARYTFWKCPNILSAYELGLRSTFRLASKQLRERKGG